MSNHFETAMLFSKIEKKEHQDPIIEEAVVLTELNLLA